MDVTIKDVAREAGVSIATVSHVINKTRYVSPSLVEKVEGAIEKTGYKGKLVAKENANNFRVGRLSEITFVVPNITSPLYSRLAAELSDEFTREGYLFSICLSDGDLDIEKHILSECVSNRRIAGMVLVPCSDDQKLYKSLINTGTPCVFIDQDFSNPQLECVLSDHENAMFMGTSHLIESGHERIALIIEKSMLSVEKERIAGYFRAFKEHGEPVCEDNILYIDPGAKNRENPIRERFGDNLPTAFIAGGNRLTLTLLKALEDLNLECPRDISVIGFGDDEWCEIVWPPLTNIKQDTGLIASTVASKLLAQVHQEQRAFSTVRVPSTFSIRKSTQTVGRGPFGEKAISSEDITFTEQEIHALQAGDYTVCIAFHYSGTAWASLHERGIRDSLARFGIKIMSVTDAHFDAEMQVKQLEGMRLQNPDVIVAIPADDKITAGKFKELSKSSKLVFMSSVPEGLGKADYSSCISVNERENGQNAGVLLGEHFRNHGDVKVGFISHGTPFYGTHLRDSVAAQVVADRYPNIEIVANEPFYQIENAYETCKTMLQQHPEIEGLYISWDRPALEAIRAIKELGREDVSIITFDLDHEIASYLASGNMVRGLSTQRPYEQGLAVGMAAAKALLGHEEYKYVGVPPYVVRPESLGKAWRDILKEPLPQEIAALQENALRK